jgi:2,4-dienoyl-CoA reductase-like NADH-dependent reductase (Old Yellow Enzyme family)/thioredoxin reductase
MNRKSARFAKLLEPGTIKGVRLKNRAINAPMGTEYSQRDGTVTERLIRYYEEKAKGGVGLVIVEYAYIDQEASMAIECQLGVYDNACIVGLSRLSEVMQHHGAKTCLQIVHCGATKYDTFPAVAPSSAPYKDAEGTGSRVPRELNIEDIDKIVEAFGNAAARAKQAGFDMVEIHGAHGYLITEFLSPLTNRRTDMYGGGARKRMRFALEVVQRVIQKVGADYPVGIRLSGSEYKDGGISIRDTIALSKELEKLGIAYLHISGGDAVTLHAQVTPSYLATGFNVWAAEAVKREVTVPVIASGSLTSPEVAEEVLREGKADFVSFGRPLLADPHFIRKLEEGRREDIVPCIRCNEGCMRKGTIEKRGLMCAVNIALGREERYGTLQYEELDPAPHSKRVFVIGGGPGGMEAARVASLRGHDVTLFEKRDRLGGALIEASIPRFKKDLLPFIDYLSAQIKKSNVKVLTGKKITAAKIIEAAPDAIIAATGSKLVLPEIPGIERPLVALGLDVLRGKQVGETVILVGGGWLSSEIAWFLVDQGKNVIMTTRQKEIGYDMEIVHRGVIVDALSRARVKIHTRVSVKEITEKGVIVENLEGPKRKIAISGDSVVFMPGFVPDDGLSEVLSKKGLKIFPIGDCVRPRGIFEAVYEGHIAGRLVS